MTDLTPENFAAGSKEILDSIIDRPVLLKELLGVLPGVQLDPQLSRGLERLFAHIEKTQRNPLFHHRRILRVLYTESAGTDGMISIQQALGIKAAKAIDTAGDRILHAAFQEGPGNHLHTNTLLQAKNFYSAIVACTYPQARPIEEELAHPK